MAATRVPPAYVLGVTGSCAPGRCIATERRATWVGVVAGLLFGSGSLSSGQESESLDMLGTDDGEVTAVQRRNLVDLQAFGSRDHGSVDAAEREVAVGAHELGDPQPFVGGDRFGDEVARGEVAKEPDFCVRAESRTEEVDDLGDDELGNEQRAGVSLEELEAFVVVVVVRVDVRVERPSVDDECYRTTSARRISSIRTETSPTPLRPAPAASSARRPRRRPRWASIASRVRSEIVMPRRSASCRNRASKSSGSLTVVLFTVCQHTIGAGRHAGSRNRRSGR